MASSAITRLLRVLDLEEKQSWRNRAVIGGLQAMSERWLDDARAEELDGEMLEAAVALMAHYETVAPHGRPAVIEKLRMALSGEIDDYTDLLDGVIAQDDLAGTVEGDVYAEEFGGELDSEEEEPDDDFLNDDEEFDDEEFDGEEFGDEEFDDDPDIDGELRAGEDSGTARALDKGTTGAKSKQTAAERHRVPIGPAEATNVARARVRKQKQSQKKERVIRSPHDLQSSPTLLDGVGEATAEQLARLGVNQIVDLLWHLPVRHEDYSALRTIDKLEPGEQVTIIANVWEVRNRKVGIKREMVQAILGDGTGTLHATWWNKYIAKQLKPNSTMRFSGKVGLYMGQLTLDNPVFEDADADMIATGRLAPVYRLTEGLSHKRMRELIRQVLDEFVHFMSDPLPKPICDTYELPDLATALQQIHFPEDADQLDAAQIRLAFEEFFYIQLGVLQRRQELQQSEAPALHYDEALMKQFLDRLPFQLTGAQQRVLGEITHDVQRTVPMTRLVQGDVGSGKTAVAAGAMWVAAANGAQSAMLAPTQILAEQHYRGISQLLADTQRPDGKTLQVALLTGRVTGKEREEILTGLNDGTIDIVVGTTALIQEQVQFDNLGFVVVDEQHRFGVEQRGALRTKSARQPHLLVMSATPIPRSLALTIYGDLDVSAIDEMPPGRMEVKTKRFRPRERERLYGFARREIQAGRQVFVIYPLVEESEKLDVGSAVEEHARLSKEIFPDLRLALLHGRMSGSEKDEVMQAFADRQYDILVSTSVIEVGIDIPNASLIIVEDAERFGLAQLHQFRGRVGRGQHQSYCALVSKANNADAEARLKALEETNNGFALAEKDLELRGPGDFLGTRQSGLPELRIAHLSDIETLNLAREAAQSIFGEDPTLNKYSTLQKQVWRFWRGQGDVN